MSKYTRCASRTIRGAVFAAVLLLMACEARSQDFTWSRMSHSSSAKAHSYVFLADAANYQQLANWWAIVASDFNNESSTTVAFLDTQRAYAYFTGSGFTPSWADSLEATLSLGTDNQEGFGTSIVGESLIQIGVEADGFDDIIGEEGGASAVNHKFETEALYVLESTTNPTGIAKLSGLFDFDESWDGFARFWEFDLVLYRGSNPDGNGMPQTWTPVFSAIGGSNHGKIDFDFTLWEDYCGPYLAPQEDEYEWDSSPSGEGGILVNFDLDNAPVGTIFKLVQKVETIQDAMVDDDFLPLGYNGEYGYDVQFDVAAENP